MKKWICGILAALLCVGTAAGAGEAKREDSQAADAWAVYQMAWRYAIREIEASGKDITNARITRLEPVALCRDGVSVYALEYAYQQAGASAEVPGGTGQGSPYLFVAGEGEGPRLLGVRYTREVFLGGGYEATAAELLAAGETVELAKQSTASDSFDEAEIDGAIQAVRTAWADQFDVIDLWFDEAVYQSELPSYQSNTLYGMDAAAARGDIIILRANVYQPVSDLDPREGQLYRNWTVVLTRESGDSAWRIVSYGY